MFTRIVRLAPVERNAGAVIWRDTVLPAAEYEDLIVEADRFIDAPEILYACRMDADGGFTVLKDTVGLIEKMGHTFAGWPISSPIGKVVDLDPRALLEGTKDQ